MTKLATELDVRAIPPRLRHPEIFGTFDRLVPGESFVLVNDHDPKPLLYQFQVERAGAFDWTVLEAGPERYRIQIHRRAEPGPRSVSGYLEWDHRRLDGILEGVRGLVERRVFTTAAERFAEFSCGLTHHIAMEEEVLFPAFEKASGMTYGPTDVMRLEHTEIKRAMAKATEALAATDAVGFERAAGLLVGTLGPHNDKEEQILYPMSDRSAGTDRDRDDLVKRMQAV